ncbi:MAG: DUF4270 family protein [Chitinophagaceae bacterium]|nr:DUF4270 family protein [Chitinophagaceae bacterium]
MKSRLIASLSVLLAVVISISACNKIDTTTLGGDLIPSVDNISTFETILDVITDNKLFNDTTRMLYDTDHGLGIIENDAEFGKTSASIYSSFTPIVYKVNPFTRRDSITLDSVVLSLAYTRVYGDSNSVQHIEVKEITPTASFTDSLYPLSNPDFPTEPALLGSADVAFNHLSDSIQYMNGKDIVRSKGEMRIKLDTAWARKFVDYDTVAGQPYYNDTLFKEKFKGLEIKAADGSPVKKALAYFNLSETSKTRITFYYRKPNNGKTDTTFVVFNYTRDPHANLIRRTPANNYLANVNNATENDELLYIQSTPGSYSYVRIPGLDTLKSSLKVIHLAELICEKAPSMEDFYAPPGRMFIDAINSTNDSAFTIRNDYIPTTSSPGYEVGSLGGDLKNDNYVFKLTRYVQSLVTYQYPNPWLRIYAPFSTQPYFTEINSISTGSRQYIIVNEPVAFGRVILYGGAAADTSKRLRLRIIYSKI